MDGRGQEKFGNAGYKHSVSSGYGQKMGSVKHHAKTDNKNDDQSKTGEDEYRVNTAVHFCALWINGCFKL